jgi:hypothetical protein
VELKPAISTRSAARRAGLALAALAVLTPGAHAASSSANAAAAANATVYKATSVTITSNLSTGTVKTTGNGSGTLTLPATYPLFATPAPTYSNAQQMFGANTVNPNAARIDVTGQPGAAFSLNFQSWTLVSGQAGSTVSNNTYYSASNSPTTLPSGVFDSTGKATIYIGGVITVARANSGTTVILKPNFTITYN